jgi:hypothetical protein
MVTSNVKFKTVSDGYANPTRVATRVRRLLSQSGRFPECLTGTTSRLLTFREQ